MPFGRNMLIADMNKPIAKPLFETILSLFDKLFVAIFNGRKGFVIAPFISKKIYALFIAA
jgi:hypothetical protein